MIKICSLVLLALLVRPLIVFASTISLTESQRVALARLTVSNPEVKKLYHKIQREAEASVRAKGNPIRKLGTAGRLDSDSLKLQSMASLGDMKKLHALGYAFAVTQRSEYSAAIRRIILHWAKVNQPTGVP